MIVVLFGDYPGAARVFALHLEGTLEWHEFCSPGITPFTNFAASNAVLAGDGLFFETAGAAFRFNLATPYCDE
jgi:hypothetical protein